MYSILLVGIVLSYAGLYLFYNQKFYQQNAVTVFGKLIKEYWVREGRSTHKIFKAGFKINGKVYYIFSNELLSYFSHSHLKLGEKIELRVIPEAPEYIVSAR